MAELKFMRKIVVIGIASIFLLNFPVSNVNNNFVVATDDGLELTLNENGVVESLKTVSYTHLTLPTKA